MTDLSSLSLFAANKAQVEEAWRRTYEQWGKTRNLSPEQHRMREASLAEDLETSRDGKQVIW
jgi:hypothetical protein